VPIEAPFFISIAGLSASLAGLAGLVAALRRGEGLDAADRYRLRQIVEFAFANITFAVLIFPLSSLLGSLGSAIQLLAATIALYLVINALLLVRRARTHGIPLSRAWVWSVALLNLGALALAAYTVATASVGAYAGLLVILLVRPMFAFLFVLASFEDA